MQYKYVTVTLPSNGLIYPTKEVHLRNKTIFDIKALINNPYFQLKSEIDTLQNCIDPRDNINVYDLVNQDVVYLLYKLRSMSNDDLIIVHNKEQYVVKLSELDVIILEEYDAKRKLPESGLEVELATTPIKDAFSLSEQIAEFEKKYPEYIGDVENTVKILNSILCIDNLTNKDHIRNKLESLSYKDSLYLIDEIEKFKTLDFGIVEEVEVTNKSGNKIKLPITLTEEFFRPTL